MNLYICPSCGHKDLPIWRHTLRRLYTDHCHVSDLEVWNPELAKLIKEKGYICVKGVKYKLNKKGSHVHRIAAELCKYPSPTNPSITEPNTEKGKARVLGRVRGQTKLLESGMRKKTKEKQKQ